MKEKNRVKGAFTMFCKEPLQRQCTPWVTRVAPPSSFLRTALSIKPPHLSTVSVSICASFLFLLCILSKICPIVTASSLNTFWFMKVFMGALYFWIAWEICTSSLASWINPSLTFLLLSFLLALPEIFSDQREKVGESYFIHTVLFIFYWFWAFFFFCFALIIPITTPQILIPHLDPFIEQISVCSLCLRYCSRG